MTHNFSYDVFLSHNSEDQPRVRLSAERLKQAGLRVWFDEWNIRSSDIYFALLAVNSVAGWSPPSLVRVNLISSPATFPL